MATLTKRPRVELKVQHPVPSDIEIAQAATPLPIAAIADALGLAPGDYNQYGPTAAKVRGERVLCQWGEEEGGGEGRRGDLAASVPPDQPSNRRTLSPRTLRPAPAPPRHAPLHAAEVARAPFTADSVSFPTFFLCRSNSPSSTASPTRPLASTSSWLASRPRLWAKENPRAL